MEYVRSISIRIAVDTNKDTYEWDGDDWRAGVRWLISLLRDLF